MHSSFLYATIVCHGAIARCLSLNMTTISFCLLQVSVASCGCCLYLILARILVGNVYSFLIRCHPVVVTCLLVSCLSVLSQTITMFFVTSVLMTYALNGSLSPCLCPIVKKYAHSWVPTFLPVVSSMSHILIGNLWSKKSLMGMLPIKHNH